MRTQAVEQTNRNDAALCLGLAHPPCGPLSAPERIILEACEAKIKRGLESFLETAEAFLEVRERRLYREKFGTFEEYCREVWNITPRRARQVLAGAEVVQTLRGAAGGSTVEGQGAGGEPEFPLPTNERQTRALQVLPKEKQAAAWKQAVASSANGRPTGKQVAEAVELMADRPLSIAVGKLAPGVLPKQPASRWPWPTSSNGAYTQRGHEQINFTYKDSWAGIALLQVAPDEWVAGSGVDSRINTDYSHKMVLKAEPTYPTRAHALIAAANQLFDWQHCAMEDSHKGSGVHQLAEKIAAWAAKMIEEGKAETRAACVAPAVEPIHKPAVVVGVAGTKQSKFETWNKSAFAAILALRPLVDLVGTPSGQDAAKPRAALRLLEDFRDAAIRSATAEASRQRWNEDQESEKRVGAERGQKPEARSQKPVGNESKGRNGITAAQRMRIGMAARARWQKAKKAGRAGR